ncbi:hypothetical protein [Streptomyces sp. NPDC049906]|uniref:hypothetical protein n=1 Tax=Streptomyces sp. NPDC049906 TaxID=3155656 RepID=UPI00341A70BD
MRCARRTAAALPVQVSGRTRAACPRCGPDLAPGPSWDESPRPVAVSARTMRGLRSPCMGVPVAARASGPVPTTASVVPRGHRAGAHGP